MWTAENRGRYNRDHLRYPSDLTDAEWIEIAPLIAPARGGGRRREVDVRNLVNGVINVLTPGCQATPNNYRIDRISDAPVRNKKQTGDIILISLDKFRAEKAR